MIPNLTWGADFAGLINYLVENRDHEVLDLQGVSSIHLAADEMALVAGLSHRAKNKLLHLSLSAAHEDGELSCDQWLEAAAQVEHGLALGGHQRVVVRHRDKTHDHVHIFWCTISLETGCTPPKQWFLKKGCGVSGIGPHALTDDQCARIPVARRNRHTYDFRALARCQDICRQLERKMGLRQLRTPEQAATARLRGEPRAPSAGQKKRADRTGSVPLLERAQEIRSALDTHDWPSKQRALAGIGLDLEPVFRSTKSGDELRELIIFDAADPGNRIRASDLDIPGLKYGVRRIEERHEAGAATLEAWWPERDPSVPNVPFGRRSENRFKANFDLLRAQHRLVEREKRQRLKELRTIQAKERTATQRALMKQRRERASQLSPHERRAFYKRFSINVRAKTLAVLARKHATEATEFARARVPVWSEYLAMLAARGDREAAASLGIASRSVAKAWSLGPEAISANLDRAAPAPAQQPAPVLTTAASPEALLLEYRQFQALGR